MNDLGYLVDDKMYYATLGIDFELGLKLITCDMNINEAFAIGRNFKEIHIFISHVIDDCFLSQDEPEILHMSYRDSSRDMVNGYYMTENDVDLGVNDVSLVMWMKVMNGLVKA